MKSLIILTFILCSINAIAVANDLSSTMNAAYSKFLNDLKIGNSINWANGKLSRTNDGATYIDSLGMVTFMPKDNPDFNLIAKSNPNIAKEFLDSYGFVPATSDAGSVDANSNKPKPKEASGDQADYFDRLLEMKKNQLAQIVKDQEELKKQIAKIEQLKKSLPTGSAVVRAGNVGQDIPADTAGAGMFLKKALEEAPMWAAEAARFPGRSRALSLNERIPLVENFQGQEGRDEKIKRATYEAANEALSKAVTNYYKGGQTPALKAAQDSALAADKSAKANWVPAFNAVCKQIANCMYGYSENYKNDKGEPAFGITEADLANLKR